MKDSPAFDLFSVRLEEKVSGMGAGTPLRYAALATFLTIAHSFLEEYYWRWFVFGRLARRLPFAAAMTIAAIGFASHHILVVSAYIPWSFWELILFFSISVAIGGAVWSWLYYKSGNLWSAWISHLIVDAALLAVGAHQLYG